MNDNKSIIQVYTAYFFSIVGDSLFQIAIPLFIYKLTKNAIFVSLFFSIKYLPYIFIMPFIGGIIAKYSKKKYIKIKQYFVIFNYEFYDFLYIINNKIQLYNKNSFFIFYLLFSQ